MAQRKEGEEKLDSEILEIAVGCEDKVGPKAGDLHWALLKVVSGM